MGISAMTMSRAVRSGALVRLARGVYAKNEELLFDPLKKYLPVTAQCPDAAIALISALTFHELTDEEEREVWIALPHARKFQNQKNVRIIRLSGLAYSLGIENHPVGKRNIKIYDREKCVVDAFKYLPRETAIKALKMYVKQRNIDLQKLLDYGKQLNRPLQAEVETIMTE